MIPWLSTLFSELHREHLKPLGFKKERSTFSRNMGVYHERFNFQGGKYNTPDDWQFFVNVGIEFNDLEPGTRHWSFFANTHWANRVEELVPEAPQHWEGTTSTDAEALKAQLHHLIVRASDALAVRANQCRAEYLARLAEIKRRVGP